MKVMIEEIRVFGGKLVAQISLQDGEKREVLLCSKPNAKVYRLVYEGGIFPTLQPIGEGHEHGFQIRV